MEELLQHCMRELAFDGDLGCDVSRLGQFIHGFYISQHPPIKQTVDDAFHAFIWALLVRQPSVCVGLVPEGKAVEVYIAPQNNQKKTVTKPKKKQPHTEPTPFPALEQQPTSDNSYAEIFSRRLQPIPEAITSPLNDLIQRYGNSLRVAVDPETCFRAITGSHTRPAKLSPLVYTALQFISRCRETGLSVVDLGKKTGYDQKTCYYLIKQLLSLDLVVKLGQGGPGGGNFCIHKYFYMQSAFWQKVRREENVVQQEDNKAELTETEESKERRSTLQFDPIDSRHLASPQLIKSRLIKLLKNSANGLHTYQNLLVTIGFVNPSKRDRRFFIVRIGELIKDKVIEKVIVPKQGSSTNTLCIRLVEDPRSVNTEGVVVQSGDTDDEEQEAETENFDEKDLDANNMPVTNMTIHRQLLKLLEEAGPEGMTLNNLSTRLGAFDKRTIELLLYRLERYPPPSHLADLSICDFIENEGRERRHRYLTLPGYLSFVQKENIDDAGLNTGYTSIDTSNTGGFYPHSETLFYADRKDLFMYEDQYRDKTKPPKEGSTRKIGRPRKEGSNPKKTASAPKDPSAAPKKRGRPKKVQDKDVECQVETPQDKTAHKGTKRKRKDVVDQGASDMQPPPKKARLQKPKTTLQRDEPPYTTMDVNVDTDKDTLTVDQSEIPALLPAEAVDSQAISNTMGMWDVDMDAIVIDANKERNMFGDKMTIDHTTPAKPLRATGPNTSILSDSEYTERAPTPSQFTSDFAIDPALQVFPPPSVDAVTKLSKNGTPSISHNASGLNTATGDLKRGGDNVPDGEHPSEYPAKRFKGGRPKRTHELINLSQLRAENEIMRVVDESGGIANISSKEFFETYARIVCSMVAAGEPTSMPVGNQPDRRTIRKILDKLVDRGRLKTLSVTITPRVTQPRIAKLIYDPATTQEKIDTYLTSLREETPVSTATTHKVLDQPLQYSRPQRSGEFYLESAQSGGVEPFNKPRPSIHDINVLEDDEDTVRSKFLSERQTTAQLYGYLLGRVRRARELHQYTLAHINGSNLSSYVVSQTERIIASPYYFHDLPVATYFVLVPAAEYSPELSELMQTPEGRQTPVKNLPQNLHDFLKIGRARARSKILSLFEILVALKLVTPLKPSESSSPYLTCVPNGCYPNKFDIASAAFSGKATTARMASFWRFNTIAPIYVYSQEDLPFHRDIIVRTADESMQFWVELEDSCFNKDGLILMTSMDSMTGSCTCTPQDLRILRRSQSWISSYILSRKQEHYLHHKWTDPQTGYTPLSDEDGGRARIEGICNIVLAPFQAVHSFFDSLHDMFHREANRINENVRRRRDEEDHERRTTAGKAILAKKAAEARRRLGADWEALITRVHPDPLPYGSVTRTKELKSRYLQSRGTLSTEQWEKAVNEAITGLKSGKRNPVLPKSASGARKTSSRTVSTKLSPVVSIPQNSVKELIERYKDKTPSTTKVVSTKKTQKGGKDKGPPDATPVVTGPSRRQRFQWTPEYDELARDACAIIRARCRTWYRMDWTALDQLFTFLPRNNVRQRLATLRQESGGEAYFRLLEDKWHELWLDHRGTEALPDDHPGHPSNFDAIAHVEFLRKYIDKRALRVGISEVDVGHSTGAVLTENVSDFLSKWDIQERDRPSNGMDFMWSSIGDEHREKTLLGEALSIPMQTVGSVPEPTNSASNGVAESAIKMMLATREEDYVPEDAALFLDAVGPHNVRQASEELLARGILSEAGNTRRKRPGRKMKISDLNEEALGGSFLPEFFTEACAIEDTIEDEVHEWKEWSVLATSGEIAVLLGLISEGKVEFRIDVSEAAAHRQELDWNSKKVDDDQIESVLALRYRPADLGIVPLSESSTGSPVITTTSMDLDRPSNGEHGMNCGQPAPCRQVSEGIITCSACIDLDQSEVLSGLEDDIRGYALKILEDVENGGHDGLSYQVLSGDAFTSVSAREAIRLLTSTKKPLCYWLGYTYPVLVSRRHVRGWTVAVSAPSLQLVFPRRWLNIKGEMMVEVWNAGLRAVVGVLISRPGISQAELRQKLILVYDRQEVNDLLSYLWTEELVTRQLAPEHSDLGSKDIREISGSQEQSIHWTLGVNAWYRVNE